MTLKNMLLAALLATSLPVQSGGVVVIGHESTPRLDPPTLAKVFTGKVIEVNGVPLTPVNASAGSALRARFLQTYLKQDDDKYIAYWLVRRYIGKGAPPRELASSAEILSFVQNTPGAIGYIDDTELPVSPPQILLPR